MNTTDILEALDKEIAQLQQARALLAGDESTSKRTSQVGAVSRRGVTSGKRAPGRPKGSASKQTSFDPKEFTPKRRTMSPEGRERIAAAQRARWALKNKKAATAKKADGRALAKLAPSPEKKSAKKSPGKAAAKKAPAKASVPSKAASAKKPGLELVPKKAITKAPAKKPVLKVAAPKRVREKKATQRPRSATEAVANNAAASKPVDSQTVSEATAGQE